METIRVSNFLPGKALKNIAIWEQFELASVDITKKSSKDYANGSYLLTPGKQFDLFRPIRSRLFVRVQHFRHQQNELCMSYPSEIYPLR